MVVSMISGSCMIFCLYSFSFWDLVSFVSRRNHCFRVFIFFIERSLLSFFYCVPHCGGLDLIIILCHIRPQLNHASDCQLTHVPCPSPFIIMYQQTVICQAFTSTTSLYRERYVMCVCLDHDSNLKLIPCSTSFS